ncbi:uncharacterized protein LOC135137957 [Zophobas morio]|uniref:uncharacterized protein LOC135137957 n=1 Tax=Zophobas morio TaxID=2755281 RepID=UPI0030836B1A
MNDDHLSQFKYGKLAQCDQTSLTGILKSEGKCYSFQASRENLAKYDFFFKNLCLCTDQPDVKQLKKEILETLEAHFCSNETVFLEYLNFITHWSIKEGKKLKLDKTRMKRVIALCVCSPFTKSLSFVAGKSVDDKENIFREAVSKCDLVVIEKNNFERIESVWSDAIDGVDDMEKTNKINKMYQIMENWITSKESLYAEDASKVSKLMWLREKSPLVVEGCPQVYKAIKTCQIRNLIVLDNQETFSKGVEGITNSQQKTFLFRKLFDLKEHTKLYDDILMNFTYSLEGQREIELKFLQEVCDIDNFITTDDLIEMLKAPLLIGNSEALPPSHIERKLTKILTDVKFLRNMDYNTVALIDCVTDVNSFQQNFPGVSIKINDVDTIQSTVQSPTIYIYENEISKEKFDALCKQNVRTQIHYFKYLDDHRLEWIRSENCSSKRGWFEKLDRLRIKGEFIDQRQYFKESWQNINIICADPGMGKSTLLKSLKSNSPSSKWTILIYARNHPEHFRKNKSDMDKFLKYILDVVTCKKYSKKFHQAIFKTMLEQNQIELAWDGLDEASDDTQASIVDLVKAFSERGVKQWLTSRNNLKNMLEEGLGSLSRNIKQLNEEEQRAYIRDRLQIPEDKLSETFSKIRENIMAFPNYEILGIPLQIYMLTELFSKDLNHYLNLLDGNFTVLKLYEHFVKEKFNVLYADKNKIPLMNESIYKDIENTMNCYQHLAANSYNSDSLAEKPVKCNFDRKVKSFLIEIKNEGDEVGIISRVHSNNDVEFAHNSYGEYFAALYLFNYEPSKARDKIFISNRRSNNIRFFLDLMLAKNCKGFVAILYKNPSILEELTDEDLKQKDVIGRDILEVACAYSKNYPVAKNDTVLTKSDFNKDWVGNTEIVRYLNYRDVGREFNYFNSCFHKLLLFLPFLVPLYDGTRFDDDYLAVVLYYAIKYDVSMIFECIENSLSLKTMYNSINPRSVLGLALYNRSRQILRKQFSKKEDCCEWDFVENLGDSVMEIDEIFTCVLELEEFQIEVPNSKGQLLIHYSSENRLIKTLSLLLVKNPNVDVRDRSGRLPIQYACEHGDLESVELLVRNGAKLNVSDENGLLLIHYACKNWLNGYRIIPFLIEKGVKVDSADSNGRLPIHYASEYGNLDAMKSLVENGAKVDVPDGNDKKLPIHYAFDRILNVDSVVSFFKENGANLDSPDGHGRLPIHYACEYGCLGAVKSLVANGAKVNDPDGDGKLPIYYACQNRYFEYRIITFLINKGAKVDSPNYDCQLPIHYACEFGDLEEVMLLVANGAKVDVPDRNGRLPMHYASKNRFNGHKVTSFLIKEGAKVDSPDDDGRLPIHYACEFGDLDEVMLLVANGAKVDVPDRNGRVPMHYASKNRFNGHRVTSFLIEEGAKVDSPDDDGRLPIHYACEFGDLDEVMLLVASSAKVDIPDRNGRMPMHYAFKNRFSGHKMLPYLIKQGSKIDSRDHNSRLPIHYASEFGDLDDVMLLVANGAKVGIPDRNGRMPMHYACKNLLNGHRIMSFLLKQSSNVESQDNDGRLPIHYACEFGDLDKVMLLVANGARLDVSDRDGRLPMHYACKNGFNGHRITSFLIKKRAKVNFRDNGGRLPIHYACEFGDLDEVMLLVASSAKIEIPDRNGRMPMHYASKNRFSGHKILSYLIKQGSKIDFRDRDGRLPIHHACEFGDLEEVMLLVANGAKVDVPDRNGRLPMHYASKNRFNGHKVTPFLIKEGAEVDSPDNDGRLPIHYACEYGDLDEVMLLVANGTALYIPDRNGRMSMHYASKNRFSGHKISSYLIKQGLKIDSRDHDGQLPIHYACEFGDLDEVMLLIANDEKVDIPDGNGRMPMHYACKNLLNGHRIMSFLLKQSSNVESQDNDGRLPIHYACEFGDLDKVMLLVANGARLDVSDRDGRLPMHCACKNGFNGHRVTSFLIKQGAKVDSPDDDGRLPIHYACEFGDLDEIMLLVGNGPKVGIPDKNGRLTMHYACKNRSNGHRITSYLIRRGAKVDSPDNDGRLPIHYSCEFGDLDEVMLLVANGAKMDIPDRNRRMPMHYACRNRFNGEKITSFLIRKGAKVDSRDHDGRLPIHYACRFGDLDEVMLLVANGAEVNIPDRNGRLPMHYASKNRFNGHSITSFLIKKGGK